MGNGMAHWGNAPWRPTDAAGDSPAGAGSLGAALVVVRQRDTRCVGLPRSAATDHCAGRSAPRGSNDPGTSYRLPATSYQLERRGGRRCARSCDACERQLVCVRQPWVVYQHTVCRVTPMRALSLVHNGLRLMCACVGSTM